MFGRLVDVGKHMIFMAVKIGGGQGGGGTFVSEHAGG